MENHLEVGLWASTSTPCSVGGPPGRKGNRLPHENELIPILNLSNILNKNVLRHSSAY